MCMDLTYHVSISCYILLLQLRSQTSMTAHICGIFDQFVTMIRFSGYWNVVQMIDRNKQDCMISEKFVGHRVVSVSVSE